MTQNGENPVVGDIRAGALIGRAAYDKRGNRLGVIADVIADGDLRQGLRITHVVVAQRPWGRLLGYERQQATGPWLLQALARIIMHRRVRTIEWTELHHGQ
jgi:hypothetical protein